MTENTGSVGGLADLPPHVHDDECWDSDPECAKAAIDRERERTARAEAAVAEAIRLMRCHAEDDEQGRWAPCYKDGTFAKDKALPPEEWCGACVFVNRPDIKALANLDPAVKEYLEQRERERAALELLDTLFDFSEPLDAANHADHGFKDVTLVNEAYAAARAALGKGE